MAMYLIQDDFSYLLADREFYEPIDRYDTGDETYLRVIRRILPVDWSTLRKGLWLNCFPPAVVPTAQGWKIHVSATPQNACQILTSVGRFAVARNLSFKYVAEPAMLLLQNSKRWDRGGAGKFITLYPDNEQHCREMLEGLRTATTGYRGPYILSDRRYRDSEVVHYRYGGLLPISRLDVEGRRIPVISADNQYTDDKRDGFFHLPPGMIDPFIEREEEQPESLTLKNGRYRIDQAIRYSVSGGVYRATDLENGRRVLIKEARPLTNVSPRGADAAWLLKKEHRLLEAVADLGIAPQPLDFFRDWEHWYLVEEYIDGIILRGYSAQWSVAMLTAPSRDEVGMFFSRYTRVMSRIAEILEMLHERHIIFSDVSHYNVMIVNDGERIVLIDFEGAYEEGVDLPTLMFTPGFAPSDLIERGESHASDDCFALGSLMLAAMLPMNALMSLAPEGGDRVVGAMTEDFGLPPQIRQVMRELMSPDRDARPKPRAVVDVLRDAELVRDPDIRPARESDAEIAAILDGIVTYIVNSITPDRTDRLFPAAPIVYETNPLNLASGACGVAQVLRHVTGSVPQIVIDWMLARDVLPELYPPGLYTGLCGIAWTMLDLGFTERAHEMLRLARGHYLLRRSPDLMSGAAGWGMTELKFRLATGDDEHLRAAEEAARFLIDSREEDDGKSRWKSGYGYCAGLGHGSAGIALFFTYLYAATGREEYLDHAERALRYVDAMKRNIAGGVSWRVIDGHPTSTPYWRWGSAGVGVALLRFLRIAPHAAFEELLEQLFADVNRKYAIFAGRFFGLSGIGDYLLDAAAFTGQQERYRMAARRALAGVLFYRADRPTGIAFPGDTLNRVSCDLGTGSAGVALFLHRYLTGSGPLLMLDELLPTTATATAGAIAEESA